MIYLLDSDINFNQVMKSYFERVSLKYKLFTDLETYKQAVEQGPPLLTITELEFEGVDLGSDLIRWVKERNPRHPVVVASGLTSPESVDHALECGANDYLFKPVDRKMLNSKISNFINSDELDDWTSQEIVIPDRGAQATLKFTGSVVGLDELGFDLESKHLIPSGTVLRVAGELVDDIFVDRKEVMLVVSRCLMDPSSGLYLIYGEFVEISDTESSSVRNWIMQQSLRPS